MMKTFDIEIDKLLNKFQSAKGKANCYFYGDKYIGKLVEEAIRRFKAKRPNASIFVYCNNIDDYNNIHNKVLSYNAVPFYGNFSNDLFTFCDFSIVIGNVDIDTINYLIAKSNFIFIIFNKYIDNSEYINTINRITNNIGIYNLDDIANKERINSPVEECRVGVALTDKEIKEYKEDTDFINNCVSTFGSIDNIIKSLYGDRDSNISSIDFRINLAKENGWVEDFNGSDSFAVQVDKEYNPDELMRKATTFFSIAKHRRDLIDMCDNKCNAVVDIIKNNPGKQILVVSNRGEGAAKISDYIRQQGIECGDYHDCLDDTYLKDENGDYIIYKSGVNKGKPKLFGSQAQSSLSERLFNRHIYNVLSIKSSSNKKLKTAIDLIIFTSPLCDNIVEFKKRFTDICINESITKEYIVYAIDTIEQDKFKQKPLPNIIKVEDSSNVKNVDYDETSGDVIL